MHATAPRLARLIACAAVPAMLIAGCSSGSKASSDDVNGSSAPSSTTAAPTLAAARYTKLPDPCRAIAAATVKTMVPSAQDAGGKAVSSGDDSHAGCSWTGLDGYQYRFLDDTFQRFDTIANSTSAEDQAKSAYQLAVQTAAKASGAKAVAAPGLGDQATLITWDAKKDGAQYHYAAVIARSANAIVTVDFSGAGLQGDEQPKTDRMNKDAEQATKEALAALK
ncbi:DUF3558 domain-containing protein [Streptantibioticus parmotrematis]|uniref:DUF3558 domain-containing protein n=1 Tax=Streptantibioticus parmotrematis TaxID=2873249 RepID=UPI003410BF78